MSSSYCQGLNSSSPSVKFVVHSQVFALVLWENSAILKKILSGDGIRLTLLEGTRGYMAAVPSFALVMSEAREESR